MFDEPDHLEPVDWLFHVPGPGEDVDVSGSASDLIFCC